MTAPQKSEWPVGAGQVAEGTNQNGAIVQDDGDPRKTFETVRARLALHGGHAVHELSGGGYLVVSTKWQGMCREVPDLRALIAFCRQLGVPA